MGTFARYFEKSIAASPYLSVGGDEDRDFLAQARRAIRLIATELDALPVSDRFWRSVEGYPTFTKLLCYSDRDKGRSSEAALWCSIALRYLSSSGYFHPEEWGRLRRHGDLDVRWPIHSAYYIAATSGDYASHRSCLSRDVAAFLTLEGLSSAAQPALISLPSEVRSPAETPSWMRPMPLIAPSDWSARVLHGLQAPGFLGRHQGGGLHRGSVLDACGAVPEFPIPGGRGNGNAGRAPRVRRGQPLPA